MTYSQSLAERARKIFRDKQIGFAEKKMMGGLCFMVNDKMCIGVDHDKQGQDRLMARVGPEVYAEALTRPGAGPMDFTGRSMRGYIFVSAAGIDNDQDLAGWIQLALNFNPLAKASKKRRPRQ